MPNAINLRNVSFLRTSSRSRPLSEGARETEIHISEVVSLLSRTEKSLRTLGSHNNATENLSI